MSETAISGTRRTMKELADGTIRVQIDIDPAFRAAFLQMFPNIDMPVAIAPLVADFERVEKPKGGTASQWLAMRCKEREFWSFLESTFPNAPAAGVNSERTAVDVCRIFLGVKSRAEIDTDPIALARFHENLREPWIEWLAR